MCDWWSPFSVIAPGQWMSSTGPFWLLLTHSRCSLSQKHLIGWCWVWSHLRRIWKRGFLQCEVGPWLLSKTLRVGGQRKKRRKKKTHTHTHTNISTMDFDTWNFNIMNICFLHNKICFCFMHWLNLKGYFLKSAFFSPHFWSRKYLLFIHSFDKGLVYLSGN